MAFEQDVLEEVTRQRARYAPDAPVADAGRGLRRHDDRRPVALRGRGTAYPQVRSQENVLRLQGEIERLEGQLADRRELYNDQVYRYNTTIAQVPAMVLAALLGWRVATILRRRGAAAEQAPEVSLASRGDAPEG